MFKFRYIFALTLFGALIWLIFAPSPPRQKSEIHALSAQLFEFGAVHFFTKDPDPSPLFNRIAAGETLTKEEDCQYRALYHNRIQNKSWLFDLADENIFFAENFAPNSQNNCGTLGLKGRHDIHDLSALQNFKDITQSLASIPESSKIRKIYLANNIQKDLEDLMLHFAPATHAIALQDTSFQNFNKNNPLGALYLRMINGFKGAEFSKVNSCEYWENIDQAIKAYSEIVLLVQDELLSKLTKSEFRIAGRWLSPRTLAPSLNVKDPLRPRPDCD